MFYKEILEKTGPGNAFLEHLEAQIKKKNFRSAPTMVVPLWVQCMYRSAQKHSGYVTYTKKSPTPWLKDEEILRF